MSIDISLEEKAGSTLVDILSGVLLLSDWLRELPKYTLDERTEGSPQCEQKLVDS